jgi:hypothetical protein
VREKALKLEQALAHFDSGWLAEEFKLIRLDLIIKKFEGKKAAECLIRNGFNTPRLCRDSAFIFQLLNSGRYADQEYREFK